MQLKTSPTRNLNLCWKGKESKFVFHADNYGGRFNCRNYAYRARTAKDAGSSGLKESFSLGITINHSDTRTTTSPSHKRW